MFSIQTCEWHQTICKKVNDVGLKLCLKEERLEQNTYLANACDSIKEAHSAESAFVQMYSSCILFSANLASFCKHAFQENLFE